MRMTRTAISAAVVVAATTALTVAGPALAAGTVSTPSAVSAPLSVSAVADDEDEVNDLRVAIVQLISLPYAGSEVREKGRAALDGTVEEMRAFLETGYRLAQAQDDRVALAQLISRPETTPEVRAAAIELLRASDPEEMRWFLETGQYEITG